MVILTKLGKYQCACCGYYTLESLFAICPVCYWQKDVFQEEHIDDEGGPNAVSLRIAKLNFEQYGASEMRFLKTVRGPISDEMLD